ncbi:MAG TPA: CotH kinase family protein [Polyangiaceae bacterium]|nr:CotH kinase family protein [Polyangiaceae bacterium]
MSHCSWIVSTLAVSAVVALSACSHSTSPNDTMSPSNSGGAAGHSGGGSPAGGSLAGSMSTAGGAGGTAGALSGGAGFGAQAGANGGTLAFGGAAGSSAFAGASFGGGGSAGFAGAGSGGAAQVCPPACGPSYEAFFNNNEVATLKVYIEGSDLAGHAASDWLALLKTKWKHCRPFDNYVRSRVVYEGSSGKFELSDVGIRLRGSREQPVRGFKLDFQKLLGTATGDARRRFADLNRVNILSIEDDDSHMVQCLAYKALRDFGVQAPRCNHLRVYVNDQFYGLLESVEEADHGRFLRHHWGTSEGLLVEASPSESDCGFSDGKANLEYEGDTSNTTYAAAYKAERGTQADMEKFLFPMFKCADKDTTPDDAQFKTCISEWLDVQEWLKVIAFESLTPELESFIGYKRNFYLYFHPDATSPRGGRFLVYPWDLDTAFQRQKCYPSNCDPFKSVSSFLGSRGIRPPLVTRLTTVFKTEYCTAMKAYLNDVFKTSLIDDMAKVVEPAMMGDPHASASVWQAEVSKLRSHIDSQKSAMGALITAACGG